MEEDFNDEWWTLLHTSVYMWNEESAEWEIYFQNHPVPEHYNDDDENETNLLLYALDSDHEDDDNDIIIKYEIVRIKFMTILYQIPYLPWFDTPDWGFHPEDEFVIPSSEYNLHVWINYPFNCPVMERLSSFTLVSVLYISLSFIFVPSN